MNSIHGIRQQLICGNKIREMEIGTKIQIGTANRNGNGTGNRNEIRNTRNGNVHENKNELRIKQG